jgi:hypothetical protein
MLIIQLSICKFNACYLSFFQPKYIQRLKAIKATLEVSDFFSSHEVSCNMWGMYPIINSSNHFSILPPTQSLKITHLPSHPLFQSSTDWLACSLTHIHSPMNLPIHSPTQPIIHSLTSHVLTHSLTHSHTHMITYLCTHPFTYAHLPTCSPTHFACLSILPTTHSPT